jgi:hypothetical protein
MFFDKTDGELGKTITVVVAMKNRPEKQSEPYIRMGLSRLIASGGRLSQNWCYNQKLVEAPLFRVHGKGSAPRPSIDSRMHISKSQPPLSQPLFLSIISDRSPFADSPICAFESKTGKETRERETAGQGKKE